MDAVDHDLHLLGNIHPQAVIGHPVLSAALLGKLKSWHQPQHAREITVARGCDPVRIDHGDRARRVGQRLRQTGATQYQWQRFEELVFSRV